MRALVCRAFGPAGQLVIGDWPDPQPRAGEVVIDVRAAALNFPDNLMIRGRYQVVTPPPFVPGSEYAGVIEAVGEGVKHLKPGQRVACLSGTGGFGTHTLAPAALCMPLPEGFPAVDAAAFIMIYATSYHALMDRAQLKAGETVLILGAAGGVGTAAIGWTATRSSSHPPPSRPQRARTCCRTCHRRTRSLLCFPRTMASVCSTKSPTTCAQNPSASRNKGSGCMAGRL